MNGPYRSFGNLWGRELYPDKCPKCGRELKVLRISNATEQYETCAYCGGRV